MQVHCYKCGADFEVSEDYIGYETECPRCQDPVLVMTPMRAKAVHNRKMFYSTGKNTGDADKQKRSGGEVACFLLGLFFSLFGVLIAYLFAKKKGAVAALWGLLVEIVLSIIFGTI